MSPELPRYRCPSCGNRTRFDVFETVRRRRFVHFTLAGDVAVEDEEILDRAVERVVCRWCDQGAGVDAEAEGGRTG